ncbi:ribonuclease E/G [Gracilibacillus phocaeensis]|nr:ribonuclease E/G [Gracilibacillus phocaeensis]
MKLHFITTLSEKIGLLLDGEQCLDIFIEREIQKASYRSVYLGKVRNIDESMEAAFIDIGEEKVAFLPKRMIPFVPRGDKLSSYLQEGKRLLVQISKEAYQDKGPQVTADIAIAGQHLVFLPIANKITASRKLPESMQRHWKNIVAKELQNGEGIIIRTNVESAEEETICKELWYLRSQWTNLLDSASKAEAPVLLWQPPLVPNQMLNDYQNKSFDDITFDDPKICQAMQQLYPNQAANMRVSKQRHRFAGKHINQWLVEAIQPEVRKQDGMVLTVEETAALSVIDIDSHAFKSRQNKAMTTFQMNKRAVVYAVEEIRKRNMSGMIMIDFLKMKPKEEQVIIQLLNKCLREDPVQTKVFEFTALGLLEMTRKRERIGLLQLLTDRTSAYRTPLSNASIAYQLQRELVELERQVEAVLIVMESAVYPCFHQQNFSYQLDVYYHIDETISGYQLLRAGSQTLINEYMKQHPEIVIDKFS